jgi:ATP synthase protein I
MKEFYQLRNSLLIATLVITVVSFTLVWIFYSFNTSLNYLLGACFSLVYVNLLAREVERVGTYKKKIGSTRLAIFIGLVIIATQREQLQVIPIFLGFMTYKAAILFYILPSSLLANLNKSEKKG